MKLLAFLLISFLFFGCQTPKQEDLVADTLVPEPILSCDIIAEMVAQDLAIADYQHVSSFQDDNGALVFLSYNYKKELSSIDVFTPPGYPVPADHILNEGRDCWTLDEAEGKTYYWKHWYLRDHG